MNYYDILKSLCRTTGVKKTPPTTFSDTSETTQKLKQYINNALADIYSEEWNFRKTSTTFSTVAAQSEYTLPAGVIEKIKIGDTILKCISDPTSLTESSGSPTGYYVYGTELVLYPTPNAVETVTVYYMKNNSGLNSGGVEQIGLAEETDLPNFSVLFHDLVVKKAELIYIRDKNNKDKVKAESEAKRRIAQLVTLDRGTLESAPTITL